MSARAFRIIAILLGGCVVAVLLLQAYWINHLYAQKKSAFEGTVYDALQQMADRLHERENISAFKKTYRVTGDSVVKKPRARVTRRQKKATATSISQFSESDGSGNVTANISVTSDNGVTVITTTKNGKKQEMMVNSLQNDVDEMQHLVDKMLTEIRVLDSGELVADTLQAIIRRILNSKGLFQPFDYSLRKIDKTTEALMQSDGFNEAAPYFAADLSAGKIFNDHRFLWVQFPETNVLAGMKGSIALSVFFSLIILGAFYQTMRLILRQKKISEIRTDLVNNMTHELKTPIATISLAVDAMANPQVRTNETMFAQYGRILKEENQKLNDHVERVLQIALLDKGELQFNKKRIDLCAVITAAIRSRELQVASRKATILFTPPATPVELFADPGHLEAAFSNLLDNALKYSHDPCRVDISVTARNNLVSVSFKDNGIGIAILHREKVFEKFYRVQGGDLHDVKGSGLGLSYVRSIIGAHGGTIVIAEGNGAGSEFIITFKTNG